MKAIINKDKVVLEEYNGSNSGSFNYYEIECEFDETWDGLTKEIVIAKDTDGIHRAIIGNKAYIDKEYSGKYAIGFVGYTIENDVKTYQISTNLVPIGIIQGAGEININEETVPTPSQWEAYIAQIEAMIEDIEDMDIDASKEGHVATVTITKKDGTTKSVEIYDGQGGAGNIQAGTNISIDRDGDTIRINNTYDDTELRVGKQDKLIAGDGITIDEHNVIRTNGTEETIIIQSNETVLVENCEVPALNDRQIRTAYDGVLAGKKVLIVNEMETLIANVIDVKCIENTDISVILLFEDKLILTYKMGGIIIGNNIEGKNAYETIKEVGFADNSYLFDVSYNNLDYSDAKEYFDNNATTNGFGCSAIVKDGVLGRNYDWFYSNQAEFRVSTNKTPNRYATTGIATMNGLNKDDVKLKLYSPLYKYLPFSLVDGQNEKGLQGAILVVPNDNEDTVGTSVTTERPEIVERINALMLIRYALDRFANIQELKNATNEYLSIYVPQALRDMGYECHFIFKDDKSVEVLEFINNNCVWVDVTEKPVLTNFFISGVTFNQDGKIPQIGSSEVTACGLTSHSMGLERYNILVDGLNSNDTVDGILQDVKYTQLYKNDFSDNPWISEYCGTNSLTIDDAVTDFYNTYVEGQQEYERRTRSNPVTDQTVHTSIYSDKLKIYTQERYGSTQAYEFNLAKSNEGAKEVYTGYYDSIHDKFYPTMVFEEEMIPVNNAIFIDKTDINAPSTYLCIVGENNYHYNKTNSGVLYWLNPNYYLYGDHTYLPAIEALFLQEIYNYEKKGIPQTLCWTAPGNIEHKFKVLSITEFPSGLVRGYGLQIIVSGRYNCVYSWSGLDIGDIINPQVIQLGT